MNPITRHKMYLATASGEWSGTLPKPRIREEIYLANICHSLEDVVHLDDSGLIPIEEIPKIAFSDCITVENDTARFALTTADVQKGDTVYVNSTEIMYFVVDDTKLNLEAGYKPLAAGIAAQAVCDKNSNDITTTYATISYVDSLVGDINSILEEVL